MAKTKKRRAKRESDSVYLLKLVLYLMIGAQWLHVTSANGRQLPLPIGLLVGVLFAVHEQFQIDRKIEFAILLVAMLIGFWTQAGLYLTL